MNLNINIGIDFGTTNICISYYSNNKETILLDGDSYLIPSYITFANTILIGNEAKNITIDDKYKLNNLKRLIGEKYCLKYNSYPYEIKPDTNNNITIVVDNNIYYIEELLCMFFNKIKSIVYNHFNSKNIIINSVLTVPAYFNDNQRSILKSCAEFTGIHILKLINEPTAAAISYFHNITNITSKTIMIYDLGGGTFDITVLNYEDSIYNVLETYGNPQLGGEDFDNCLAFYCLEQFCSINNFDIINIYNNKNYKNIYKKIKNECKKCKEALSYQLYYDIYIDSLYMGIDLIIKINRSVFESVCKNEFTKCKDLLNNITTKIDEIILIGGSTRMPQIKTILNNYYPNIPINDTIDPDQTVAIGASIIAYNLLDNPTVLLDVVNLPIGIEINGGINSILIHKNTVVPYKICKTFSTEYDYQPSFDLKIWEGESLYANQNNFLGKIDVKNLPLVKKGELKIFVTFKIDFNNILHITIKYNNTKIKNTLTKNNNLLQLENSEWINVSIKLFEFKNFLINKLSIANSTLCTKINKLLDWINMINNKDILISSSLTVDNICKMQDNIELLSIECL